MSSVIQNMLDNVIGDGARATKFDCMIHFGQTGLFGNDNDIFAMVKTSSFPGKSHDVIDFKYKGRTIPIKGQVKYDNTWSCTFYMTQDHKLKTAFEDWIESLDQRHNIKGVSTDVRKAQINNSNNGYTTTMYIAQKDFLGAQDTTVYELNRVFPKSVSAVEVDYSSVGTITEFTVEFSYAYFNTNVQAADTGTFVDSLVTAAQSSIDSLAAQLKGAISNVIGSAVAGIGDTLGGIFGSDITSSISGLGSTLTGLLGGKETSPTMYSPDKMITKKYYT